MSTLAPAADRPEQHRLKLEPIDPKTASKARKTLLEKHGELFHGFCSCGHWRVEIGTRLQIREVHDLHVQDKLGPDGSETEAARG